MMDRGDQGLWEDPGHMTLWSSGEPKVDLTLTCWSLQVGQ